MAVADTIAQEDSHSRPWIVEFHDFRYRDDRQREILQSLDRGVLAAVMKIWLKVVTPGAAFDPCGATPNLIRFPVRSMARHFVATFGGRLIGRS
jgi:hypothetical protein